jgi:hypothetical protein
MWLGVEGGGGEICDKLITLGLVVTGSYKIMS